MNYSVKINDIRSRLRLPLPGKPAQYKMAPEMRHDPENIDEYKEAAVLILLYPNNKDLHLAFIKRNDYDGVHSGQISLPGGMLENHDKNLSATALRETNEEIGVKANDIDIIGKLTPLPIAVSSFIVHPFVGYLNYLPVFTPDSLEVQYLILPKLLAFKKLENIKTGLIKAHNLELESPYYHIENEIIWGATAMIMSEFMELIDC